MLFRFLHAADIHLDSPLQGLARYDGAPVDEIRGATRRALQNLVELAIDHEVHFVLIAGDVYDGDWKDHNTGLFFVSQMARLRAANIPVYIVRGNHDAANKMTRSLRLPDNVQEFSPKKAETFELPDLGVAIHGLSYQKAAELGNLVGTYPARRSDCFNIGVLHTSLGGAAGHEPYAPCTLDDLRAKQYDYWALGHVHTREIVCDDPLTVFPGNIQGRHIRETGPKGCVLVTGDGREPPQVDFHALDVFRWQTCLVDATGAATGDEVLERCAAQLAELVEHNEGLPLAVRVRITGRCAAHAALTADPVDWTNQVRAAALDVAGGSVWVEKVRQDTAPQRALDQATAGDGPLGELLDTIQLLRRDPDELAKYGSALDDLVRKLPDELKRGSDPATWTRVEGLSELLDEIEPLLVGRLLAEGDRA